MGGMSHGVASIAHAEVVRRREDQLARTASVRARSAGVLGASGVAATLAAAVADNGGYVGAVLCFLFATVYAVKSMRIAARKGRSTMGLLNELVDAKSTQEAYAYVVQDLVTVIETGESLLHDVGGATKVAMAWFVAGTALTSLTALVSMLLEITARG